MFEPVVVLDAAMTVDTALEALADARDSDLFVIRRVSADTGWIGWYVLTPSQLPRVLLVEDRSMSLGDALDLRKHPASEVRDVASSDVRDGVWTGLVVHGGRAVGWCRRGRTRPASAFHGAPATGAASQPSPTTRAIDFSPLPAPAPPVVAAPRRGLPGITRTVERPATPADGPPSAVSAFAHVEVPEEVAPAARFDIVVGLGSEPQESIGNARTPPMLLAPDLTELTVQVKADTFTIEQVRHTLVLDPNNLGAHSIRIPLVAPRPPTVPWRGRIEVEYSARGLLLGSAWRDVVVRNNPGTSLSTSGGDTPLQLSQTVPIDLTVSISRGATGGKFLWTFTTPHPVPLPTQQVETDLQRDTAETFALRKVRELGQAAGSANCELKVAGVAQEVALATPVCFWTVLTAVWAIARAQGRRPTVLLVSQESFVPWELAATTEDFVVDRTLVDTSAPQVLGAQVVLGRWRPAGPETPCGIRRPATSPAESIVVERLAVVVGEYRKGSGIPALPEAIVEGQALTASYPSVWVKGTDAEVGDLLRGSFTDHGQPVRAQVLHVAAHGSADPDDKTNAGVVLADTAVRIDETIVIGSPFARVAAPLVFLNCCQLASDGGGDLFEGGLAAAFLEAGARGFIAPLWSISDQVAREAAVTFYEQAYAGGVPVGEVMRRLRARFNDFPGRDEPTPLAYAYYGHPGLVLTRKEG